MPILRNIGCLVTGRPAGDERLEILTHAALFWKGDRFRWVGTEGGLPELPPGEATLDAQGGMVIPGLIDCHTHLAFAGWRADEFEARIRGSSYLEIAKSGGGILRTVEATRRASRDELVERCLVHLRRMAESGVVAVEAKSGYGLDIESELKLLEVYRELNRRQPVRIIPTLLAAHVVPPEFENRRADYVRMICSELIPEVAGRGLARFCDVFLEAGAFTAEDAREILACGWRYGLRPKLHADQLSAGGGAELAAEVGAVSADHLEHASEEGLQRLAKAGVVAVLLPVAELYLGEAPASARRLVERGLTVAVATDFNPGTAPTYSLTLALLLACTLGRLTPAEALVGATRAAARAVGEEENLGTIEPGKRADFVLLDAEGPAQWISHFGGPAPTAVWIGGRQVAGRS
jgi:imidazolonepropionase